MTSRTAVVTAALIIVSAWLLWLFSATGAKPSVAKPIPHTMPAQERADLEKRIRAQAEAEFQKKLKQRLEEEEGLRDAERTKLEEDLLAVRAKSSKVEGDLAEARKHASGSASAEDVSRFVAERSSLRLQAEALRRKIALLAGEREVALDEVRARHSAAALRGIEAVVSSELLRREAAIIADGARATLDAFCRHTEGFPLDTSVTPRVNVDDAPFELFDATLTGWHGPATGCVGVGADGDAAVPTSAFLLEDPEAAERLGRQAVRDLRNASAALVGKRLRPAGYSVRADVGGTPAAEPPLPCCSRVLFALHPVFGAFFRALLPVVDEDGAAATVPVCYRRRWWPLPDVDAVSPPTAALTSFFNVSDTAEPEADDAAAAEADILGAGRERLRPPEREPPLDGVRPVPLSPPQPPLVVVLPFQGRYLARLPVLLRSFAMASVEAGAFGASLVVAVADPWHPDLAPDNVTAAVTAAVAAASDALKVQMTSVVAGGVADGTGMEVPSANAARAEALAARMNHAGRRRGRALGDAASLNAAASPFAGAVLEALGGRAEGDTALVLDPTTYRVGPQALSDAASMVVAGHAVWSPVVGHDDDEGGNDDDGSPGMPLLVGGWDGTPAGCHPSGHIAAVAAGARPAGSVLDSAFWSGASCAGAAGAGPDRLLRGSGNAISQEPDGGSGGNTSDPSSGGDSAGLGQLGNVTAPLQHDDNTGSDDDAATGEAPLSDEELAERWGVAHGVPDLVVAGLGHRHATLGASVGDLGLLLLTSSDAASRPGTDAPAGPECLGRRLLVAAEEWGLLVQRTSSLSLLSTMDPLDACQCPDGPVTDGFAPRHCERAWVRAVADDPADTGRLQCALRQLSRAPGLVLDQSETAAQHGSVAQEGGGRAPSAELRPWADVTHTVRRFDPSLGLGVTASLRSRASGEEAAFDFEFPLSKRAWQCTRCGA